MSARLCIFLALFFQGTETTSPPFGTLVKIKTQVTQNLKQLPNFTCTEQIERWWQRPSDHKPEMLDTIHLDVAYVDGKELFGPPKAGRVDQPEIHKLVTGTISQGSFATIVPATILGPHTIFHDEGSKPLNGQPAELFSFSVGALGSRYQITTSSGHSRSGYRGKFWADPVSGDLMRFEMSADDIPPVLELTSAGESIDYRRVVIGSSPFLLPYASELRMKNRQGYEIHNFTTYQNCHQFVAGSTMSFASDVATAPPVPDNLPADFTVRIRWQTPVDPAKNMLGDPVFATLLEDIKMNAAIAVPQGAKLSGHVASIDKQGGGYAVRIVFTSFDFEGGHIDLGQRVNEIKPVGAATLSLGAEFSFHSQR